MEKADMEIARCKCGSEARIAGDHMSGYSVRCVECQRDGQRCTYQAEAIASWNSDMALPCGGGRSEREAMAWSILVAQCSVIPASDRDDVKQAQWAFDMADAFLAKRDEERQKAAKQ